MAESDGRSKRLSLDDPIVGKALKECIISGHEI